MAFRAEASSQNLPSIATTVTTLGSGRVKPSEYFRPTAHTTSSSTASTSRIQDIVVLLRSIRPQTRKRPGTSFRTAVGPAFAALAAGGSSRLVSVRCQRARHRRDHVQPAPLLDQVAAVEQLLDLALEQR